MRQKELSQITARSNNKPRFEPVTNAHMLAQTDSAIVRECSNIVAGRNAQEFSSVYSLAYIRNTVVVTTYIDSFLLISSLMKCSDPLLSNYHIIELLPDTKPTKLTDEDIILLLISSIRERITAPYSNRLVDRLNYLYEVRAEDSPEQDPIPTGSLRAFLEFFATNHALIEPDLVLSPLGNICAEWHRLPNELLSVEFLPSGQVNYCVFALDTENPVNINRSSGIISANSLIEIIAPFKILSWIIEKA